jgi:hypothetical protein
MNTRRVLAAAAVAGWSKGILGAAVLPAAMEQPAGAVVRTAAAPSPACTPAPVLSSPTLFTSQVPPVIQVYAKGPSSCPGTLDVLVTSDHDNWGKAPVIASRHIPAAGNAVVAPCFAGTFWYKGRFVSDDGSVYTTTDSVRPTQFTC